MDSNQSNNDNTGIQIIDISNPKNPLTISIFYIDRNSCICSFYTSGNFAYLDDCYLEVIDINNPNSPQLVETFSYEGYCCGSRLSGEGDYLFMTNYQRFTIIDVSDPSNLKTVNSYETSEDTSFQSIYKSRFRDVYAFDQYVYVTSVYSSYYGVNSKTYFSIIDTSTADELFFRSTIQIPHDSSKIHLVFPYAYIMRENSFFVIDVTDPDNPSPIDLNGYVDLNNDSEAYLREVHIQLPYIHLAFSDKYQILDISQCFPTNPTIAQWPMSGPGGTRFTQWGTGFTPNTTTTLHFQKPDGTEYPTKSIAIETDGHFEDSYNAPLDKPIGNYTWWAVDATGAKSNEVTYTITERPVPTIAQWPMKGTPGTTFTQWGSGFTPNSIGTLHVQKPDGTEYPSESVSIKEDGSFELTYKSKVDKTAGTYSWWVVDGVTGEACTPLSYVIEAGETGVLAGFSITQNGGPIADQQIGVPFSIEVQAIDGAGSIFSFSDEVDLWSNICSVKPMKIKIEDGQWSGMVMLDEAGKEVVLSIEAQGKSGHSDSFEVVSLEEASSYIFGTVQDHEYNLVQDVDVILSDTYTNEVIEIFKKSENGFFQFDNISPGFYRVSASINDDRQKGEYEFYFRGDKPESANIFLSAPPVEHLPVLFVPGIMGSTHVVCPRFPLLPKGNIDPIDLMILDDPIIGDDFGWKILESYFIDHDIPVVKVPYDWRKDIDQAVNEYLIKAIEEAKNKYSKEKVNVVAHSMGGLLVREYIQSDDYKYKNDIEKFAMVGTPNHGSANAYYLWSGGDPIQAGTKAGPLYETVIIANYNLFNALSLDFWYSKVLACRRGWASCVKEFVYIPRKEVKSFINEHIPSVQRLLPTYLFLEPHDFLECEKNKWLVDLNNSDVLKSLFANSDSEEGVKAKIFAGKGVDTISTISVGGRDCDRKTYKDGKPKLGSEKLKITAGDGTVLVTSANMIGVVETNSSRSGEHSSLIDVYKDEIFTFITTLPSPKRRTEYRTQNDRELVVSIMGKSQPYLLVPEGNGVGLEPTTGDIKKDIANSEVIFRPNASGVTVPNPSDGEYTLSLKGNHDESILVNITFQTTEDAEGLLAYLYNHSDTATIEFILDGNSEELLIVDSDLKAVDGLRADPIDSGGLKTRLTWTESDNPNVISYNIYSREKSSPHLTLLGSSTINSFDTNHNWASSSAIEPMVYSVSAVYADEKESFLSKMVTNDDRDHDNLADELEVAIGTKLDSPDTDEDGLTDGDEHYYATNPLAKDSDEDTFSDKIEIDAASDPLDPNSFPVEGDINGDNIVNLEDVILSLQILSEIPHEQFTNSANEVSGDLRIGLEEAVYGLREMADHR